MIEEQLSHIIWLLRGVVVGVWVLTLSYLGRN